MRKLRLREVKMMIIIEYRRCYNRFNRITKMDMSNLAWGDLEKASQRAAHLWWSIKRGENMQRQMHSS